MQITTITLLHADFTIGSDSQVNAIKSEGEYIENDSRQHFPKKGLVIFISDVSPELAGGNYQEEDKLLLRSRNFSGDHLKVMDDIKKNGTKNATHIVPKHKLRHTSAERARIRNQLKELSLFERREKEHERRVGEIVDHVTVNYQSCIYLAYEAERIKNNGIVMDDFRKMAEDVDNRKYKGLKAKVLECGKHIPEPPPFVWHKTNDLVIHVLKDSVNDGV